MSTDLLKLFGGSSVEEHPGALADRLVAAEFAVKFQNDLGVKRQTKLCGHAIDPPRTPANAAPQSASPQDAWCGYTQEKSETQFLRMANPLFLKPVTHPINRTSGRGDPSVLLATV
jgi:hypothetical protein